MFSENLWVGEMEKFLLFLARSAGKFSLEAHSFPLENRKEIDVFKKWSLVTTHFGFKNCKTAGGEIVPA